MSISNSSTIGLPADIQSIMLVHSSQERLDLINQWLCNNPSKNDLQNLYRLLVEKDKGAAKSIKVRLEELKDEAQYATLLSEWLSSARELLDQPSATLGQLLAWQKELAKTRLSTQLEPLQTTHQAIAQKIQQLEWLEHTVKIILEEEKLLCRRIELLTLQSWHEAKERSLELTEDIVVWQNKQKDTLEHPFFPTLDLKYAKWLHDAKSHLNMVENSFSYELESAKKATSHPQAQLPGVIQWANEIVQKRSEENLHLEKSNNQAQFLEQIELKVAELKNQLENGQSQQCLQLARELGALMGQQKLAKEIEIRCRWVIEIAEKQESWKKWSMAEHGKRLIAHLEDLYQIDGEGRSLPSPKLTAPKIFEQLREIKKEWKDLCQNEPMSIAVIHKFERVVKRVYEAIEPWLVQLRETEKKNEENRVALIKKLQDELSQQNFQKINWRDYQDYLRKAQQQWDSAGHVHPNIYVELDRKWKDALKQSELPLREAQNESINLRKQWIDKANELANSPNTKTDAFKKLQQTWSQEARLVPLDPKKEEHLWQKFRAPINHFFEQLKIAEAVKKNEERAKNLPIYQSIQELNEACKQENAQAIESALATLDKVMENTAKNALNRGATSSSAPSVVSNTSTQSEPVAPNSTAELITKPVGDGQGENKAVAGSNLPATPALKVVVRRGDDRPKSKINLQVSAGKTSTFATNRKPSKPPFPQASKSGKPPFSQASNDKKTEVLPKKPLERLALSPELRDSYHDVLATGQKSIKELRQRVHGDLVQQVVEAWEQRNVELLPALRELGSQVEQAMRTKWVNALNTPAHAEEYGTWLLRLEVATDTPSPVEFLTQRRLLMLTNLSSKNKTPPKLTWAEDLAQVFLGAFNQRTGQRIVKILQVLLKDASGKRQ